MTDLVGRIINNRYRLEALLGDGGMGTVYRAFDENLGRQVAIKFMHAHFARREEFRTRLEQEARTTAQLDHLSIVQIYDFGESEAGLFIAMEYVDGGSLREHLQRLQRMQKYLPLQQSLQIGAQIAEALYYAHRRGVIHRDVKPGNIILKRLNEPDQVGEQPFRALLTDFGLVKLQEGMAITQSGTTLGTPTYMSPEQCAGLQLDGRSDLYGLGVVLYELITNQLPFSFQSLSEALATHSRGEMPDPPQEIRADVPAIVEAILIRALAKEPEGRFATGAQMATALRSAMVALEGAPTRVMQRQEADILKETEEPPEGYEFHIETPGHSASFVPLTRSRVSLGRDANNDVVLPADGVSRRHARIQATSLGWEVVDLGGVNGTWLDGRRLPANEPASIGPGSTLQVGPYELTLKGPEIAASARTEARTAVSQRATPPPTGEQPPLALFLARDNYPVEPGQRVTVTAEVVNRSDIDDRVSLRVQGLPPDWVTTPDEFVTVPAGEAMQISISIQPPRRPNTPTGRQRLRLSLVSQQHDDLDLAVNASLVVGSFVAFEADLSAEQLQVPGAMIVSVRNTGNAAADFSVVARDRQGDLRFRGERGRIRLEPGQRAQVELEIEPRRQSYFGSGELYHFDVEVASASGGRQVLSGEALIGSILPTSVIYGLVFIVTFACALGLIGLIVNRDRLFGPVATATLDFTFIAQTQTAVAASTTPITATLPTGTPESDSDGDGLSNHQEAILGSDPNNPDTDGDGLSDYDEVFEHGSDPTRRDTDNDFLNDWEEVNTYGTDPATADTDGDGMADGAEVTQGRNPLVPDVTPTVTSTPTLGPTATETPIVTPSPTLTPGNTPTPSRTPTVTNTPSPSATATNTGTPTNTPPPTNTPTVTLTPTPLPTATNTPMPNPQLSCVETPPTIDGNFSVTEWDGPLFQFRPQDNGERLVQVYFTRDEERLYLAFLINDDTADLTDSLRLYFDTTFNRGDPDTADRFFQIVRDDTKTIAAGTGSNSDGRNWNANYTSDNWTAAIGEPGGGQWVVEMEINAAAEMGALANPFGMMVQVLYTGELASWPEEASSIDADTWQGVNNTSCP